MAIEQTPPFRLDSEQRARVGDCLKKEGSPLQADQLEQFIKAIEASIAHFRAPPPEGTFRDAHNALRSLGTLAGGADPPIGQLKARLARLPPAAQAYIGRRARIVMWRLGFDLGIPAGELPERAFDRFLAWTKTPRAMQLPKPPPPLPKILAEKLGFAGTEALSLPPLITALRALSSDGGRLVEGRSRGGGRRSGPRQEHQIMGEIRGAGTTHHHGGRPTNERHQTLVMHLALDWLTAMGEPPEPGRSDGTGFGDLVYSVFQWISLPEDSAAYALRKYWEVVQALKGREPLEDFLRRHGEAS